MGYYCELCNKSIAWKYKKRHFKSQLHLDNEKAIVNKFSIKTPELSQINNIVKGYVNDYNRKFEYYMDECIWNLMFDNGVSVDVKSKKVYRFCVLTKKLEKYLKIRINRCKKQRLEFSHISEMNITFRTRLDHMTYKHYLEKPLPMVEKIFIKKLYKNYELIKKLNDIHLTLHMSKIETGGNDVVYNNDEDE